MNTNFKIDCEVVSKNVNKQDFNLHYAQVFDKGTQKPSLLSILFNIKSKKNLTDFDAVTFIHEINNNWNSGITVHVRNYDGYILMKTSFREKSYETTENKLIAIELENLIRTNFLNIGYKLK